jgi:hypothetical protein
MAMVVWTPRGHIREYAHITAWDIDHFPTDVEIEARKSSIEIICKKIDALGQREDARFPDLGSLRHNLAEQSAFPLLVHLQAVADAFLKAGRLAPQLDSPAVNQLQSSGDSRISYCPELAVGSCTQASRLL